MILQPLKELYDKIGKENESKLNSFLNTFNCKQNSDVDDFLKKRAIQFHKSGLTRTYLILDSKAENIMAYYAIAFKPIFYNSQIHKVSKTAYKRFNPKTYRLRKSKEVTILNSILIAQIGRNDAFTKTDISLTDIMQFILFTIGQVRELIGTRIVLIEVDSEPKLITLYKKLGFEHIGIQDDLTQLYKLELD